MIQRLVRGIVGYGITSGGIKEDEQEMYTYGYTLFLETSICIAAMGCIGTLFDMLLEVIVFSAVFIPLRSFGGGIYADQDWKCVLLSTIVTTGYCFVLTLDCHECFYYLLLFFNIMGLLFSQSKMINIQYCKAISSKAIVICICIIYILVSALFLKMNETRLAEGVLVAMFIWSVSFLLNEYFKKC